MIGNFEIRYNKQEKSYYAFRSDMMGYITCDVFEALIEGLYKKDDNYMGSYGHDHKYLVHCAKRDSEFYYRYNARLMLKTVKNRSPEVFV